MLRQEGISASPWFGMSAETSRDPPVAPWQARGPSPIDRDLTLGEREQGRALRENPGRSVTEGRLPNRPTNGQPSPARRLPSAPDRRRMAEASPTIKWERQRARRSVALDGRPVSLDPDGIADLIDLIDRMRSGLTEGLLRTSDRPVTLEEIEERRRRKSSSSKSIDKPGRRVPNRMTSDQTELIGFMGELVADEWLGRRYGSSALWRSHYRRFVHNDGDLGNDDLGDDFEVLRVRRGSLMFEVKATTTDDLAFDLSEAEIAVAQENAGHARYRILFVGRVNDSEQRWLAVLPNPLSTGGRGRYRIVGRGIRL